MSRPRFRFPVAFATALDPRSKIHVPSTEGWVAQAQPKTLQTPIAFHFLCKGSGVVFPGTSCQVSRRILLAIAWPVQRLRCRRLVFLHSGGVILPNGVPVYSTPTGKAGGGKVWCFPRDRTGSIKRNGPVHVFPRQDFPEPTKIGMSNWCNSLHADPRCSNDRFVQIPSVHNYQVPNRRQLSQSYNVGRR